MKLTKLALQDGEGFVEVDREFGLKLPLTTGKGHHNLVGFLYVTKQPSVEAWLPTLTADERLSIIHLARASTFDVATPLVINFFFPFPGGRGSHSGCASRATEICLDQASCFEYLLGSAFCIREHHLPYWTEAMESVRAALTEAARQSDFSLPDGSLYQGGNPHLVRIWIINQVEEGEQCGYDFVLLALSISLFGTKMRSQSASYAKFAKQGTGAQQFVKTASGILKKYTGKMPAGATLNSIAAALPELSLLAMVSDSTKPAPGCAQLAFKEDIGKSKRSIKRCKGSDTQVDDWAGRAATFGRRRFGQSSSPVREVLR